MTKYPTTKYNHIMKFNKRGEKGMARVGVAQDIVFRSERRCPPEMRPLTAVTGQPGLGDGTNQPLKGRCSCKGGRGRRRKVTSQQQNGGPSS